MSNFIYIMGKSSTGKDTIYKRLKDKIDTNVYVPYTTRPMREGEQEGREYYFLNREQFEELQHQDKVMEARNYNVINAQGEKDIWTYATIADSQWDKEGDFLSIGTLESYTSIIRYLEEHPEKDLNMIPVYISIDEQERENRARKREEQQIKPNYEEMKRRFEADNRDFSKEKLEKAGIGESETFENYDLEKCVEQIVTYINENVKKDFKERYKVTTENLTINCSNNKIIKSTNEREEI